MDLLFSTSWGAAGAAVLAALFFFSIQWILGTPRVRAMQERIFLTHKKFSKDILNKLVQGLNIRVVGFVHNTLQVTLALTIVMDRTMWQDPFNKQTPMSQFVVVLSAGFFLWDLIVCSLEPSRDGAAFVLHGLLSLIVYSYMTISGKMHFYGCAFLLWEISTPFTQFRWIMHKMGLHETKEFLFNGLLMVASFFGCRIAWGSYLTVQFFVASQHHISSGGGSIPYWLIWFFRMVLLTMNCLNFAWFFKMCRVASRYLLNKPNKKDVAKEG